MKGSLSRITHLGLNSGFDFMAYSKKGIKRTFKNTPKSFRLNFFLFFLRFFSLFSLILFCYYWGRGGLVRFFFFFF